MKFLILISGLKYKTLTIIQNFLFKKLQTLPKANRDIYVVYLKTN